MFNQSPWQTYTYDNYGNAEIISYNGTKVAQNYTDASGNVIRSTDYINNLEYRASFDSLNRPAFKDVFDLTATGRNDKWSRSVEYQYDKLNNISKLSLAYSNGTSNTVHYMYNTAKLPSTVILPSNNNVNYHYDGLNRPTSTSINTANPITAQYTYTATARGASQYTSNLISTEVTNAFAYSYTYDRNGNITKIQNGTEQSDGTYDYSSLSGNEYIYDRYNQLKRDVDYDNATATYYSHDSNGNIAEKTVRGWDLQNNCPTAVIESNTYTYADNKGWGDLLTAYNGQAITYDAIGNPLNYRDGITMTWKNGRELATFTKGTVDVIYTYDTDGLRTSKSVVEDFVSTEYNYVYENGLLRQMTYGNHVYNISYDAYDTPVLLNHIVPTSGLNEYYYYGVNSRGDVEALYYSDGSLYATYDYDAYGKLLGITSYSGSDLTGTNTVANNNPLRYRSYVYDTETGLYYLQSRYYDPTTCRFVNGDSQINTDSINGFNQFAYCDNNPIVYADYSGKDAIILYDDIGYDHFGALVQDRDGKWYHFFYGSFPGYRKYLSLIISVEPNTFCVEYTGENFDLDSINSNTPEYSGVYADSFMLYGDFSSCLEEFKNPSKDYHATKNNCSQYTTAILSTANTYYSKTLNIASKEIYPFDGFSYVKNNAPNYDVTNKYYRKYKMIEDNFH